MRNGLFILPDHFVQSQPRNFRPVLARANQTCARCRRARHAALERMESHPVWLLWLTRTSFDLATDSAFADSTLSILPNPEKPRAARSRIGLRTAQVRRPIVGSANGAGLL